MAVSVLYILGNNISSTEIAIVTFHEVQNYFCEVIPLTHSELERFESTSESVCPEQCTTGGTK